MWIQPLLTFYITGSYKLHAYDNCDRNMLHNQCFNNHIQLNILSHSLHDLRVCKINKYQFIILHFNEPVHYPYIIMTNETSSSLAKCLIHFSHLPEKWEKRIRHLASEDDETWTCSAIIAYIIIFILIMHIFAVALLFISDLTSLHD